MEFTKNKRLSLFAVLIILVVYNVVVFVLPFIRGGWFWTAYSFSMLAILITARVIFYVFGREELKSRFYGIPLVSVAWRYLIIQLIAGLAQMALGFTLIPFQYGIALNTILLGACLIGLIVVNISKERIERTDEKIKEKVFFIKSLQVDVECLIDKVSNDSVKKVLKDLAETIKYSDPMSSPQLAAIENKIEAKVAVLAESVEKMDSDAIKALCDELQLLFFERNRKCKILK